jgi:phage antirepressor YoqD-like protein
MLGTDQAWDMFDCLEENYFNPKQPALPDFTNPVIAARAWADEVEKKQLAEAQVKELQPKADFYDAVADSETLFSMADTAKVLDMGIGRNKLFRFLRDKGILQIDNMPYQRMVDAGYFKVVEGKYEVNENVVVTKTTYVKQKGIDYIRKLLSKKEDNNHAETD